MAVNPHLPGDMRRDLEQLQLLYELNTLSPERFNALFRSLGKSIQEVQTLVDDTEDLARVMARAPRDKATIFERLKGIFDDGPPGPMGPPVVGGRFVKHLTVFDGDRS
jgi:hypothetical protein